VIVIREALPDEYERIGELTIAAYRALPVDHLWDGYDADILDVATRAKVAHVLVAVEGDDVLGAVTYVDDTSSPWSEWTQPGEAQFRLLATDPAARGKGAGEALVRTCLAHAAERPVVIHTTRWMEPAIRLYTRLGFERRPDRDVPPAVWNSPPVTGLPPEWSDESFLAYVRTVAQPFVQ
jgi:ribosomal protein S18 acetylase RimI-like enzyme